MSATMEQRRAADAWACSEGCAGDYTRLAKSLPALIMTSGLMQTVAFLEDKGGCRRGKDNAHCTLCRQLRTWLAGQFPFLRGCSDYEPFMEALHQASPAQFQQVTAEAMAWLRWLRQIAPTRARGEEA